MAKQRNIPLSGLRYSPPFASPPRVCVATMPRTRPSGARTTQPSQAPCGRIRNLRNPMWRFHCHGGVTRNEAAGFDQALMGNHVSVLRRSRSDLPLKRLHLGSMGFVVIAPSDQSFIQIHGKQRYPTGQEASQEGVLPSQWKTRWHFVHGHLCSGGRSHTSQEG